MQERNVTILASSVRADRVDCRRLVHHDDKLGENGPPEVGVRGRHGTIPTRI